MQILFRLPIPPPLLREFLLLLVKETKKIIEYNALKIHGICTTASSIRHFFTCDGRFPLLVEKIIPLHAYSSFPRSYLTSSIENGMNVDNTR
jgi:hypothetical protein